MEAERVLSEALALGDQGRWEEMAELLAGAVEEDPEDPYFLCWLGVAERELDHDSAAYDLFRRCLAQEPLDPHLLALAGAGLAAFDDPEAEPALRSAVLTGGDLPITRLHYGAYLAREGLFEDALEQLRAAVGLAPDDPSTHAELGTAYALKGDMRNAAAAMETALELAADDSWTRVLLGLVQLELDEREQAATELVRAASERPEDGEAQVLAALAASAAGWDDLAEEALARARYAPEELNAELMEEAETSIGRGGEAARALLHDTVAPSALHDRLAQPL